MRVWDAELLAKRPGVDYIQDGLVLWLDGINNTRNGHSSTATVWEDLSGNGYDFSVYGTPVWADDHCAFNGQFYFSRDTTNGELSNAHVKTVELCYCSLNATCIFVCRQGACAYDYNGQLLVGESGKSSTNTDYFQKGTGIVSASYFLSSAPNTCTINGVLRSKTSQTTWSEGGNISTIGKRTVATSYQKAFDLYTIRLYNRILSNEEILQNFKADSARFGIGG